MTKAATSLDLFDNIRHFFQQHYPENAEELEDFAHRLFALSPVRELTSEPVSDLCGLVLSLKKFLTDFPGGAPKVKSFNPKLEADGWDHPNTQIFVLHKDMAFLVDSIRMALSRNGLGIHGVNSTILNVVRNTDGSLQGIVNANHGESHREALIYFQVDGYTSPQQHTKIVDQIQQVLGYVEAVNDDYLPAVNQLKAVTANVEHYALSGSDWQKDEVIAFLHWLLDNHFTFAAYGYYSLTHEDDPVISHDRDKSLGLFKHLPRDIESARLSELAPGFGEFHNSPQILTLAKSSVQSKVHRETYCDYVIVKDFNSAGVVVGEHRFLGLYTSVVYAQSPFDIPLIREKLRRIYDRSGLEPKSHDGKALRQIIESHPREELFHGSEDQLYDILLGIWQIHERRQVRLFVRPDPFNKFINCIVFFPRDSYRTEIREKTERLLCSAFDAVESQFSTYFSESLLARTHFVLRIESDKYTQIDVQQLEEEIASFTHDWRDELHQAIIERWGELEGLQLSNIYKNAFPVSYQSHFTPLNAVEDIALFDSLADNQDIAIDFFHPDQSEGNIIRLRVFHRGAELTLSSMVPMLENLGFQVIGEHPYPLTPKDQTPVWAHDFSLEFGLDLNIDVPAVSQNFVNAFKAIWNGQVDDDSFNWLVVGARLDWRAVALIRVYARYMKQLRIPLSQTFIAATLANNLEITRDLVALFKSRFDPKLMQKAAANSDRSERIKNKILKALDDVENLNEDQVLRTYLDLITVTVRTNFFQKTLDGLEKDYIAVKLTPRKLQQVPEPRPEFEIFVYSARMEGVHLRAGKVARGGLRWSDRFEDYRTEVLGLVKAQQVKNAVIVPTGAKGGFVAKKIPPQATRQQRSDEGKACYTLFIQGLLDVTDNIVEGNIVPPPDVIREDDDDAYLVVAADKGTATFSDLANSVSDRYNHWLGDAFASGGSHGYDHKKMGITAKGAWVAVQRHFRELGVNIQQDEFSVVGIGDMSGDVFGNGMLLSPHIKLLGAFNHLSIFIDPQPDTAGAFSERQRLFNLAVSNWTDYDSSLISQGGGVFSRSAKSIAITPEMREAFGIEAEKLTPDALIKAMLQSAVDLIWNGGIGTYVKSKSESHLDVGDRNNDNVRINGGELKCRVFGEGGNLGITQKGRIEFSLAGGACNTDFIDNAGGVDCSDQEVNIKIALNGKVVDNTLTFDERNQLLVEMTADVEQRVLHHNYRQTQLITLAKVRATTNPSDFWQCISDWESSGFLNRELETLPDDEILIEREKNGQYLTRPEVAVLVSYSKILFKQQLLETDIDKDIFVQQEISKAFPKLLNERYSDAIKSHTLKKEVICNLLANGIIDMMGVTFVHRQMKSTGAGADDIARAFLTIREVLQLEQVWAEVEALDYQLSAEVQTELLVNLMRMGRRTSRWVIRNRRTCVNTRSEIDTLQPILNGLLSASIAQYEAFRSQHDSRIDTLLNQGLSTYAAILIDSASDLFFAFGMADVAIRTGAEMSLVSDTYSELSELLQLEWFSQQIIELPAENRWEDLARESFIDELESHYRILAVTMLEDLNSPDELHTRLDDWQASQTMLVKRWQAMIAELKGTSVRKYAMFSVALRELNDLVDTTRQHGRLSEICALPTLAG